MVDKPDPKAVAVEEAKKILGSGATATSKADEEVKKTLKAKVAEALRAPGATAKTVGDAIVASLINDKMKDEEKEKLRKEADTIGKTLIELKGKTDVETAVKTFDESVERASGLPMGMLLGGAAGLAAAAATDIGDWSSFSGIMKKLALIAVGVGAGAMINNDFGARDKVVGMFSGPKKPDDTAKGKI
jgi:hypothetical protein